MQVRDRRNTWTWEAATLITHLDGQRIFLVGDRVAGCPLYQLDVSSLPAIQRMTSVAGARQLVHAIEMQALELGL